MAKRKLPQESPGGDLPTLDPKIGTIFNPYVKDSYVGYYSMSEMFQKMKPEATIENRLMRSNGLFGNSDATCDDTIYVYKISGNVSVLQIDISHAYTSNTHLDNYVAFGYYDKSLKCYLDTWEKNKEDAISEHEYKTSSFMWHFGSIKRKDFMSRKDWIVVPREIFSKAIDVESMTEDEIYDEVYLCICTEKRQGAPTVMAAQFPKKQAFFYALPVATSLYEGQHLEDSTILLGRVMEYTTSNKNKPHYERCPGEFVWKKPEDTVTIQGKGVVENRKTNQYLFMRGQRAYSCPEIDLYIYRQSPEERAKEVNAFVWQSGNEDDAVKKDYITKGDESPYNTYSHILDCLSSDTMFSSMVSLTKFATDNAARYAVRALAKQPQGNRCFSIDGNNLVYLMGGAIYKIESIIAQAHDDERDVTEEEFSMIEDLFAVNNSRLFWDEPITYANKPQEKVRFYMQDVLGIKEGSNGSMAIKKRLGSIMAAISKIGIQLDYVYCDIEGPWSTVRALRARRFSPRYTYLKLKEPNIKDESKSELYYNTYVLPDLKKRQALWNDMLHRGYCTPDSLAEVSSANDTESNRNCLYGLNAWSYRKRRNPNIWDAVMKGYMNDLYYQYVMLPVLKSHPKAKCSVYGQAAAKGYINFAKRFETYLGGDVKQQPDMFACYALYGGVEGEYYKKLCMDNWRVYPNLRNYFSYFVGNINVLRSMLVSTQSEKQKNGRFNAFISSFNVWVNGYLQSDIEKREEKLIKLYKKDKTKFLTALEAYYNEFIYHVFLCNPDKVNSYFHIEKKALKDKGNIDNGGKYYFPFGNPDDPSTSEKFYTDCYSRLQAALAELNGLFMGQARETTITKLASETEPYVISGMKLNDKTLWRVTLNKAITESTISQDGRDIVISTSKGRKISFTTLNNPDIAGAIGKYGLWIETPLNEEPKITSIPDYYENNPAYHYDLSTLDLTKIARTNGTTELANYMEDKSVVDEFAIAGNKLYFLRFSTHTIFGEFPKFVTASMIFKVNKETTGSIQPLNIPKEILIGNNTNDQNGLPLVPGKYYEMVKYIAFTNEAYKPKVSGRIRYELWRLSHDGHTRRKVVLEHEVNFEDNNSNYSQRYYSSDITPLLVPNGDFDWSALTFGDFKIYFTQQQEKLELFRESDGVNIGRVNKQVKGFEGLSIDTKQDDTLVGKLSWLNATNQRVKYDISFYTYQGNKKLQANKNIASITVEPNGEGYDIIPLPQLDKGTTRVELEYRKQEIIEPGCEKPAEAAFFTNYFNDNAHKVISVDIIP